MRYVQKLTRTPSQMTAADAAAVRGAGWSEDTLFDAICICGFSNLMNRVVDAVGLEGTEEEHRESGRRLASIGYDATMAKSREHPDGRQDAIAPGVRVRFVLPGLVGAASPGSIRRPAAHRTERRMFVSQRAAPAISRADTSMPD